MYLLQGMESVRERELAPYNQLPPVQQQDLACIPKLSYVDVPPSLSGVPFDPNDTLKREGETEQLAFKGWVEQIYNCIWESRYRNELKDNFEGTGTIRPQEDAIGDFRLIRDDLIHNGGVASPSKTGKCKVLKWFKPGDQIVMGTRHVFDFLNQMGMTSSFPVVRTDGAVAVWGAFPGRVGALRSKTNSAIVSLRAALDKQLENGSTHHVVSVVFENGVYVNIPVEYPAEGQSTRQRIKLLGETHIDEDGNVRFFNGKTIDRKLLYGKAIDALLGMGPEIKGMGVPGPWLKFRN